MSLRRRELEGRKSDDEMSPVATQDYYHWHSNDNNPTTVNKSGINTHLITCIRIRWDLVSCTTACRTTMKLDAILVPDVSYSRTGALFE